MFGDCCFLSPYVDFKKFLPNRFILLEQAVIWWLVMVSLQKRIEVYQLCYNSESINFECSFACSTPIIERNSVAEDESKGGVSTASSTE